MSLAVPGDPWRMAGDPAAQDLLVPTIILLAKIAVPPILVALMSLAARRFGPTIGGLFIGLPWMTGPVLFFLAHDKGEAFAIRACLGIELAVWGMGAFILAFGILARFVAWPFCLVAAIAGYLGVACVTRDLDMPLWAAAAGGVATLLATAFLLPKPRAAVAMGPLPWWDIPARMATTFCLVAGIMFGADRLGPQLSGILASYPVILTVIASFTLQQWGPDAVLRIYKSSALSLIGFVLFFLVIGYGMPVMGLTAAFATAALASVAFSGALIALRR